VQTVLNSASDGATVTFAAGSYSWATQATFSPSAGVTLICATLGGCTVNVTAGAVLGVSTFSGANSHLYRVSGFTFDQAASDTNFVIWFGSGCSGCNGSFSNLRIDHNTFNLYSGSVAIFLGENSSIGLFYGSIDHNTVASASSVALVNWIGATNPTPPASPLGTANNLFVETNLMSITTVTNAGQGCMDSWGGAQIVWRYNDTTNCLVTAHGTDHNGGPQSIELYNNNIAVDAGSVTAGVQDCYRCFHHQGSGEIIAFNNSFTPYSGHNSDALSLTHYLSFTQATAGYSSPPYYQCDGTVTDPPNIYQDGNRIGGTPLYVGYPCWRQPGRDFAANLQPIYDWNNSWSDTLAEVSLHLDDLGGTPDYITNHLIADRDWYTAVSASAQTSPTSPFDGSTGMGFGTLANRPTTCTPTPSAGDPGFGGVGYFATDVGTQGTLYQCTASNTWTVYYTPYAYPYVPAGGPAFVPPASPFVIAEK
jgi:hypothetical protein